jgi:hypothetical protein
VSIAEKQQRFAHMTALLILQAEQLGYRVTFGDAYRDRRAKYGHPKSLHRWRMAIDLNLFRDGVFLEDGTGHDELHDYWDSIGGAARIPDDLNHYSVAHDGMR